MPLPAIIAGIIAAITGAAKVITPIATGAAALTGAIKGGIDANTAAINNQNAKYRYSKGFGM